MRLSLFTRRELGSLRGSQLGPGWRAERDSKETDLRNLSRVRDTPGSRSPPPGVFPRRRPRSTRWGNASCTTSGEGIGAAARAAAGERPACALKAEGTRGTAGQGAWESDLWKIWDTS